MSYCAGIDDLGHGKQIDELKRQLVRGCFNQDFIRSGEHDQFTYLVLWDKLAV